MKWKLLVIGIVLLLSFSMYFYPERFEAPLLKEPSDMRQTAQRITKDCLMFETDYEAYNRCNYNEISRFVTMNITYANNTTDYPTAEKVLERGWGKCVGKAVLFRSLMESMGYETQYVMQKEHVCVSIYLNGYNRLWNCGKEDLLFLGKF